MDKTPCSSPSQGGNERLSPKLNGEPEGPNRTALFQNASRRRTWLSDWFIAGKGGIHWRIVAAAAILVVVALGCLIAHMASHGMRRGADFTLTQLDGVPPAAPFPQEEPKRKIQPHSGATPVPSVGETGGPVHPPLVFELAETKKNAASDSNPARIVDNRAPAIADEAADNPARKPSGQRPFNRSDKIPEAARLSPAEEAKLDQIVDRFIQYDIGRLQGPGGQEALNGFNQLGSEATFALIRGMNRAASIGNSCPASVISQKLSTLLTSTTDVALLEYAEKNIGLGVRQSAAHLPLLVALRTTATSRKEALGWERIAQELTPLYADLASDDMEKVGKAQTALRATPEETAFFLKQHLGSVSPEALSVSPENLSALLVEKKPLSPSQRPSPKLLQALRAVELLEQLATPEAQAVLTSLAQGVEKARLAKEAQKRLSLYADLASDDSEKAGKAQAALRANPEETVAFLKQQLRPASSVDLSVLIAHLNSEQISIRAEAGQTLLQMGESAVPALKKKLASGLTTPEHRLRLEQILEKKPLSTSQRSSPELLQALRAVELLEQLATVEAQEVLTSLAQGVEEARLTKEAKASLARLSKPGEDGVTR